MGLTLRRAYRYALFDMFSSTKRPDSNDMAHHNSSNVNSSATLIAHGVRVEGNFVSQGDVVIEGDVDGKVNASGVLTVGTDAKLKAEILANSAIIAGQVDGTISVKQRLELKSTAKITGDISCETILVEAGASLNGKVSVGSSKSEGKSATKIAAE